MSYVALYRRYRPKRFDEVVGQDHVVAALKSAVAEDRVGHAYLFSGPRGTGKTTSARLLGKVLNCENVKDGEPCNECDPCVAMDSGTSFDLLELDAASNNKVDDIRDLIARAALGSPGRTKVYILDEVHMLSTGASNALLKTLEDPPDHVKFVLATTDPQKVLPTIQSRTQHFQFRLLSDAALSEHVRFVANDAGLDLSDEALDHVVRQGRGSARDALSMLDQVAATGLVAGGGAVEEILAAMLSRDAGQVLGAIDEAIQAGREPRLIAEDLVARLRSAFLAAFPAGGATPEEANAEAADIASAMGAAGITRALEGLSDALIDMRQVSEPRIVLEVALIRQVRADLAPDLAALTERVANLEAQLAGAPARPPAVSGNDGGASATTAAPPVAQAPVGDAPAPAPPDAGPSMQQGSPAPDSPAQVSSAQSSPAQGSGPAASARAVLGQKLGGSAGGAPRADAAPAQPAPGGGPALGALKTEAAQAVAVADPAEPVGLVDAPGDVAQVADTEPGPATPAPEAAPSSAVENHSAPSGPGQAPRDVAQAPAPAPTPSAASSSGLPTVEQLNAAWADDVLSNVGRGTKARFLAGRFLEVTDAAVLALPNEPHRERCEAVKPDVEAALATHFNRPVPLRLVVAEDPADVSTVARVSPPEDPSVAAAAEAAAPEDEEIIDVDQLADADVAGTGVERLLQAFPGAEVLDPPTS